MYEQSITLVRFEIISKLVIEISNHMALINTPACCGTHGPVYVPGDVEQYSFPA